MTLISATLAFPLAAPNGNNWRICQIVEQLDQCCCTVESLVCRPHQYSLNGPWQPSVVAKVEGSTPLPNASPSEKEEWLHSILALNDNLPDFSFVEVK